MQLNLKTKIECLQVCHVFTRESCSRHFTSKTFKNDIKNVASSQALTCCYYFDEKQGAWVLALPFPPKKLYHLPGSDQI